VRAAGVGADAHGSGIHAFGPQARLDRVTLVGPAYLDAVDARDTLFVGPVTVQRAGDSQIRSGALQWPPPAAPHRGALVYGAPAGVPHGRRTTAGAPRFVSLTPSDPAYARLADDTDPLVREASSDGGEPGAFHDNQDRRRGEELEHIVDDFLPAGLSAAIFFVDQGTVRHAR
jgi:hypothetical protein